MAAPDRVQQELAKLETDQPMTPSSGSRECWRALRRLSEGKETVDASSQSVLNLYVALRRAKGEKSRITAAQLLGWEQTFQQSAALARKFWVVPRQNLPNPELFQKYIGPNDFRRYSWKPRSELELCT